ncbi:hypothetical protein HMPREF3009_11025 [Corynebacterium sp. HMSC034H07]|nr:hypothetical protein HMPREF3009_11025 [Corynebacterium sp. HMSC034H07]
MQRCTAFTQMYYCGMLSLYREFSGNDVVKTLLSFEEAEFLFVVADTPEKSVSDDPYAEDKTHIQLMSLPGVALKLLPEGELITGDVAVRYPQLFQTVAGKTLWDPREISELEPFRVFHARGSHHYHERSKEHYVDIWEILPDVADAAMEQLLARIDVPVELDSAFGPLVLDRCTNTFEGRAEELGVDISIVYEGEELLLAESTNLKRKFEAPLTVINKVLSSELLDEAQRFAAAKALRAANRWRHDVALSEGNSVPAPELTASDVYAKLTPVAVEVPQRGNLSVEFDDGYLFGGHPVTVKIRRNGTPASLELDA